MSDTFRHRFVEAMKIREMRQVDVAERSGLDPAQISQYKNGKYEPMTDTLYKLAQALDVNVAWLMGDDAPMETGRAEKRRDEPTREQIEKKYGSGAWEVMGLFAKLDQTDRQLAAGILRQMLSQERYSMRKD